jgi:hypothetical protein
MRDECHAFVILEGSKIYFFIKLLEARILNLFSRIIFPTSTYGLEIMLSKQPEVCRSIIGQHPLLSVYTYQHRATMRLTPNLVDVDLQRSVYAGAYILLPTCHVTFPASRATTCCYTWTNCLLIL